MEQVVCGVDDDETGGVKLSAVIDDFMCVLGFKLTELKSRFDAI